jgi:hypothetical protein
MPSWVFLKVLAIYMGIRCGIRDTDKVGSRNGVGTRDITGQMLVLLLSTHVNTLPARFSILFRGSPHPARGKWNVRMPKARAGCTITASGRDYCA